MKLAEALMLRADIQKKLASLRSRIAQNAMIQEGETPHEDPEKLMSESFAAMKELESLVAGINAANSTNKLADGRTITQAIAQRDTLVSQHALIQHAIASSHKEPDRYSMSEIKWKSTLKVASLQKQAEDLAKKIRELNAAIQQSNWESELEK